MQCSLFQELMLYIFKLSHNIVEATKDVCCAKSLGTVDQSIVTRWLKKFCMVHKNLNDQARSSRPKNVDSGTML